MNEDQKTRETLSALLDGEANELEIQRLLKQPVAADALAAMRRYQTVSAVLAGQRQTATIDVSARVAEALRAEPALSGPDTPSSGAATGAPAVAARSANKSRWQLFGGAAVAASVAFGVIFSAQLMRDVPVESPMQVAQAPILPVQAFDAPSQVAAQEAPMPLVQRGELASVSEPVNGRAVDEEHMRRLNEYLMRHAQHAALSNGQGMVPFARLAGFETTQSPQRSGPQR